MSFVINWDNAEHTILLIRYEGRWTWEDIEQAITKLLEYLEESPQSIDLISVIMVSNWMPPGGMTSHLPRLLQLMTHPRCGISVVVVKGTLPEMMIGVLRRTNRNFGSRVFTARSLNAAREIIYQHRQHQLPPEPPAE